MLEAEQAREMTGPDGDAMQRWGPLRAQAHIRSAACMFHKDRIGGITSVASFLYSRIRLNYRSAEHFGLLPPGYLLQDVLEAYISYCDDD